MSWYLNCLLSLLYIPHMCGYPSFRAFQRNLVCENRSTGCGDTSWIKFVTECCCCNNHSSLKDKWSHNKQSSPVGYQVMNGGITRELDKEPSLHCSSIYINTKWSVLQQCVSLMSIHHASTSCPLLILHASFLRPPCFLYVPWRHTFNLRYTCAHHVYTMRNPCPLTSSPNPNSI